MSDITLDGLTLSEARRLFDYDPETGIFRRAVTVGYQARKGDVIKPTYREYAFVKINQKIHRVHRIIWFMTYEEVPTCIDHINRDKGDNRLCNLRIATCSQNSANTNPRSNTTSRFKGVSWDKTNGKWFASITVNGRQKNLGRYDSEIDAARVYNNAAVRAFGSFARLNEGLR